MNYSDLRSIMKTGDQIYWKKPESLIGKFTEWTHVSAILRMDYDGEKNRVCIMESNLSTGGVVPVPFSEIPELWEKHGDAYWMPLSMSDDQREQFKNNALLEAGKRKKYDLWGLVEYGLYIIGLKKTKPRLHLFGEICSGFIYLMLVMVNWRGLSDKTFQPSPEDLLKMVTINGNEPVKIER